MTVRCCSFRSLTHLETRFKLVFLPAGVRFRNSSSRGDFGDSLLEMDDSIGRIISTIKLLNKLNDTIIIFTSDNGWSLDSSYGTNNHFDFFSNSQITIDANNWELPSSGQYKSKSDVDVVYDVMPTARCWLRINSVYLLLALGLLSEEEDKGRYSEGPIVNFVQPAWGSG